MPEKKKRSRRIVSKREYVVRMGKKGTLGGFSVFLFALFICLSAFTILGVGFLTLSLLLWIMGGVQYLIIPAAILTPICGGLAYACFRWWARIMSRIEQSEPVTPLTRRNTGDLPEPETLVRASEEPPTHQSDVLLRAAQGRQEMSTEQLLRPADQ